VTFVEVAREELERNQEKINISRLSVMTGLHRDEVGRLLEVGGEILLSETTNIIPRLVGQWLQDPRFCKKRGVPRVLGYEGLDSEFRTLVRVVSQHVDARSILFQLERTKLAERTKNGVRLNFAALGLSEEPDQGFALLAKDLDTLVQSVEENLLNPKEIFNLHLRTEYDRVYRKDLPQIRQWMVEEGKAMHRRAREFISQFDADLSTASSGSNQIELPDQGKNELADASVVLTTFSFTEEPPTNGRPDGKIKANKKDRSAQIATPAAKSR